MTRTAKQQKKLGKINVVFTLKKENHKKVKDRQQELRSRVKGREVNKITGSSIVDGLIESMDFPEEGAAYERAKLLGKKK